MEYVFYFLGIAVILWELWVIINPQKAIDLRKRSKILNDKIKDCGDDGITITKQTYREYETINFFRYMFFHLGYSIWAFIGLFTTQWLLFILLWVVSIISSSMTDSNMRLGGVISFILLIFIYLNQFYFQIPFTINF